VREKWGFYMEETDKNYTEATTAVDSGRSCLAEVLVEWSVRHYLVDEPLCSTPRRRQIDLPSVESIEELRTPDYDELLKSFWETRGTWEQANGGSRHLPEAALEPLIGRN